MIRYPLALRPRPSDFHREGEPITHFSVVAEEIGVGTIYLRTHLAEDEAPWFWSIQTILAVSYRAVASSGREATRAEAMRKFRRSYERIRTAIGEQGWSDFVERNRRMRAIDEQARRRKEGRV